MPGVLPVSYTHLDVYKRQVYIYAEDIRVKSRKAVVHAESEIKNEYNRDKKVAYKGEVCDRDGKSIKSFEGTQTVGKPGETATLEASAEIDGLHFWSCLLYTSAMSLIPYTLSLFCRPMLPTNRIMIYQ